MIHDTLANAVRYARLGERFDVAFAWATSLTEGEQADGRCEIAGEDLYATVMSYQTRQQADRRQETHRRYADIQIMLEGEERILLAPAGEVGEGSGYQAEKDCEMFDLPPQHSTLRLRTREFAIFFPGEAHQPGVALGEPAWVRKVVIKVRMGAES